MSKIRSTLFSLMVVELVVLGTGYARGVEPENLLQNGGFEEGIVEPWSTYGDATREVVFELEDAAVEEDPIEGDFCLHVTVAAKGANFWDSGLQHAGHVFKKGTKYTLAAFLKCKEGTLQINFKPELGEDPWPGYGEQSFTMTEEWQDFHTTTPVMAADVNPATITFHIGYEAAEFWVDGVRFYEGDYVPPDFIEPKAVQPQGKVAAIWGDIKAD